MHPFVLSSLLLCIITSVSTYSVSILNKGTKPALSIANPKGQGYSPCKYTFNPGWVPVVSGDRTKSSMIVRVSSCPEDFGGNDDHMMMTTCYSDGTCDDLKPLTLALEKSAQDPRVTYWEGWYYLFYYASGSGLNTVYLRKTKTPDDPSSWEKVAPNNTYPWHRNGCMLYRNTPPHYCIFGEAPPLPAIGIASTTDMINFKVLNATFLKPNGPNDKNEPEVVVEASTPVIQLSTGDYFHIYSAGTPGWVPNGNYTGGWIILDANDPTKIKQHSAEHLFVPTVSWEIGDGIYPVARKRTIFPTSIVPTGNKDEFRVWYGAADANVASAVIQVHID